MRNCHSCSNFKEKTKQSFFGDANSSKPQYSKVITFMCIIVTIISFMLAIVGSVCGLLSETVAASLIAAGGCLGMTSVVWNLKKSQAENTIKLYLYSYKEILKLKKEDGDLEIIDLAADDMLNKITNTLDVALDEATTPIEQQDII